MAHKLLINRRDLVKFSLAASTSFSLSSLASATGKATAGGGGPDLEYGYPPFPLSEDDFSRYDKVLVSGNVAVITGASTGIGRAVANRLAALGFTVIGTSRRPQDFPAPSNFELWKLDLTVPGSINSFATRVRNRFPQINLLVLNAARYFIGRYADSDVSKVQETFETNLNGHQRLYQLLEPAFPTGANDYARVFFTASEVDIMYLIDLQGITIPGFTLPRFIGDFAYPYAASKADISRAAQCLYGRLRNMGSNIQVTVFYPLVFIKTDMAKDTIFGSDPNDPEISAQAQLFKFFIDNGTDPAVMGEAYGQMARLKDPFLTSYVFNQNPDPNKNYYEWLVNQLWPVMVMREEDRTVRTKR